ncbi:hypothetical protein [Streptomyces sp. 2132.2]|uniref:hypothetical protein n=1 Tax=Streptomyces sp. 2132.2 TaxID=2485161 RepID=UPI0011CE91D7|nr:hypothetical protein [Streptomyces sp. 2132.2]
MKFPKIDGDWLGIAKFVLGVLFAVWIGALGVDLISEVFPEAWPAIGWLLSQVVRLSSDEYIGTFVRDRFLLFGLIGVACVLWVTNKWPTLLKIAAQAFNPFARVGVAAVSAIAAVLVALILAGPLGQSRTKGECTSDFRLDLNSRPSLVSNTKCGEVGRGKTSGD